MSSHNQKFCKKSYQSPKLVVYGDISQLTKQQNITSPYNDNATIPPNLTNKTNLSM